MPLKDTLADEKRKSEHKANLRPLGRYAHNYVLGWIQRELKSSYRKAEKLRSIQLVVDAYDELQKEPICPK